MKKCNQSFAELKERFGMFQSGSEKITPGEEKKPHQQIEAYKSENYNPTAYKEYFEGTPSAASYYEEYNELNQMSESLK